MPIHLDLLVLLLALVFDQVFGEAPNRFHPVVWMGKSVRSLTKLISKSPSASYFAGFGLAVGLPLLWAAASYVILEACKGQDWLYLIVAAYIVKSSFALKALGHASQKVSRLLQDKKIHEARFHLRSLCSRDASHLSEGELLSASISSLAENLCDSVVAPLFYYALFGIPGAIAYRMINTLDAMLGYMDERRWLGHFSAKIDDLANYLPSRITALLLIIAAKLRGHKVRHGCSIMIRDHFLTPSPNGGWPMSAMAGLLNVQLAKENSYRLGDPLEEITYGKLGESWSIAHLAGILGFILLLLYGVTIHATA